MMQTEMITALAGLFGALIGALATIVSGILSKRYEYKTKKSDVEAEFKRKTIIPLIRTCIELDDRLIKIRGVYNRDWLSQHLIDEIKSNKGFAENPLNKGYFFISTLYLFAKYLGRVEILNQRITAIEKSSNNSYNYKKLNQAISKISKLFQYRELFNNLEIINEKTKTKDAWRLHRQFQHSIGELMIDKTHSGDMTVKTFLEFFRLYTVDSNFQFWFIPLEELIGGLSNFESNNPEKIAIQTSDLRPLRISSINYFINILIQELRDEVDLSKQNFPKDALTGLSREVQVNIIQLKLKTSDFFIGQNN